MEQNSIQKELLIKNRSCISSDEIQYPIEAISSRIAQISLLDTITISLSVRDYDNAAQRAKRTREFVNCGRYITKENQ